MNDLKSIPQLSVVVCTYNRSWQLRDAVGSLSNQTLRTAEYEVIDNNRLPNMEVRSAVADFQSTAFSLHPDHLRYLHCPSTGLSQARNCGFSQANGEIVCFMDDDALAAPAWLETIKRAFSEHPDAGVIGGHIKLIIPEPRPRVLKPGFETYWSHFVTGYQGYTEVGAWAEYPLGCNWCARRKALVDIGGFRTDYGRKGNDYWGGEELVAASHIQSLGYRIAIVPQAEVFHNVEPQRYHLKYVWRTILARTLVSYQARKDLHIPTESAFRHQGKKAWQVLQNSLSPSKSTSARETSWAELLMKVGAQLVLLLHQLRDFWLNHLLSLRLWLRQDH
jgi:GT2 family glycosyltransferase